MATPTQELIERKASVVETAYIKTDENQLISKLIDRIKNVSWELRYQEIIKILKEIQAMKEPQLTDYIFCLKEAVTRIHLCPDLNMAITQLQDEALLRRIREIRNGKK